MGKASPEFTFDDSVTEPELSEAVGSVHDTVAVATPLSVVTAWDGGQLVIEGFSLSGKNQNREIGLSSYYLGIKYRITLNMIYAWT